MTDLTVTIDGPAGSGKSTTARLVAERLGYRYIDSGALYRAIAWKAMEKGIEFGNSAGLGELAGRTRLRLEFVNGRQQVWVDDEDVTEKIREPEVSGGASSIARDRRVRDALTEIQREMAVGGGVVLEGRDSGTVVLPSAGVKVFLTASVRARAKRRQRELDLAGTEMSVEDVERDLERRDAQDSGREHAPLRVPGGALEIDTTDLSIEQQVQAVVDAVRSVTGFPSRSGKARRLAPGVRQMRFLYRLIWRVLNFVGVALVGFRVVARDHVPWPGGCIVACNHVSFWDPPIVGMAVRRESHYLAKKQLFRNRFFGWFISSLNAVPIDRERIDRQGLKMAQDLLRSGCLLLVFPEGTRQKTGCLGKALPGVGLIAVGAGVPVVPAYISGTLGFWRNFFRRGRLCVRFGEAVSPGSVCMDQGRVAAARWLSDHVMERIGQLKSAALGES
ncbi:MAG: (d)CMP kinase [Candidatus Eisenbacteria sp.]|nr:(d)CMP kinase [Candidatus Eisenbacteria bacterium]